MTIATYGVRDQRSRVRSGRAFFVGLLLAGATVAACSSDESNSADTSTSGAPDSSGAPDASDAPETAAEKPEAVSINTGGVGISGAFLGLFVSRELGMQEDAGIDEELVQTTAATGPSLLSSGSIDILWGGPSSVTAQLRTDSIVMIGNPVVTPGYIYARDGEGISSVADLKGKKVGNTSPGGQFDVFLRYALIDAGLDPDTDVEVAYLGDANAILAGVSEGTVEAGIGNFSTIITAKERGFVEVPVPNSIDNPGSQGVTISTNVNWADEHGDVLKRYLQAQVEAANFLRDPANEGAIIEVIEDEYNLSTEEAKQFYDVQSPLFKTDLAEFKTPLEAITAFLLTVPEGEEFADEPEKFVDYQYLD